MNIDISDICRLMYYFLLQRSFANGVMFDCSKKSKDRNNQSWNSYGSEKQLWPIAVINSYDRQQTGLAKNSREQQRNFLRTFGHFVLWSFCSRLLLKKFLLSRWSIVHVARVIRIFSYAIFYGNTVSFFCLYFFFCSAWRKKGKCHFLDYLLPCYCKVACGGKK